MTITEIEKRTYEEKIQLLNDMDFKEWGSISFADKEFRLILIKAMYNLMENSPGNKKIHSWTESSLLDDSIAAKIALKEILLDMVKVATVPRKRNIKFKNKVSIETIGYSTGELATFFGVSTTTINNWINEGRFLKELNNGTMVKINRKATNEKIKIHPDAWFDAPSGIRYQVKEAVQAYQEDLEEWEVSKQTNTLTEDEQIQSYLDHFQKKYDGKDFNTVFGNKDWNNITSEEETDAGMWSYFLQRFSNEKNSRD